jgi:hypothetical protein
MDFFKKPSDGLEPSTPSYHGGSGAVSACTRSQSRSRLSCKQRSQSVSQVPARDRGCSRSCTRLVPAACCRFLKRTTRAVRRVDEAGKARRAGARSGALGRPDCDLLGGGRELHRLAERIVTGAATGRQAPNERKPISLEPSSSSSSVVGCSSIHCRTGEGAQRVLPRIPRRRVLTRLGLAKLPLASASSE